MSGRIRQMANAPLVHSSEPLGTAWEVYNDRAYIYDRERIKDWNDTLNTLLIFAALYSAILTAFIVESMKLLREDATETTRDILLVITKQLANNSTPAFERTPFVIEHWAIGVNTCFLVSIVFSLMAVVGSVLALQWVGSYDTRLNPSSPKDRALQRHLRFMGMKDWKVAGIIACLPILLFISLFLFLVGLAVWLLHLHRSLSFVAWVGVILEASVYGATTIVGIWYPNAPFQTPVSRYLPVLHHTLSVWAKKALSSVIRTKANNRQQGRWEDKYSFIRREENTIRGKPLLELDCLLWAVNSITILPHSRDAFKLLMKELMDLPTGKLLNPKINNAPWSSIFAMLCEPYFNRRRTDYLDGELKEEVPFLAQAMAMIGDSQFTSETSRKTEEFLLSLVKSEDKLFKDAIAACARQARWRQMNEDPKLEFKDLLESTVGNLLNTPLQFSALSLTLLHNRRLQHPNTDQRELGTQLQEYISSYCGIEPNHMTNAQILPNQHLDVILQMITADLTDDSNRKSSTNPLIDYLSAYEEALLSGSVQTSHQDAHTTIRRQFFARLAQIPAYGFSGADLDLILDPIYDFMSSTSPEICANAMGEIPFVFSHPEFTENLRKLPHEDIAKIVSVAFCNQKVFNGDNWSEWFIQISIGCDERLQTDHYGAEDRDLFMRLYYDTLGYVQKWIPSDGSNDEKLGSLQTPCVQLAVSTFLQFPTYPLVLTSLSLELWDGSLWQETVQRSCDYIRLHYYGTPESSTFMTFIHTTLVHGSQATQKKCIEMLTDIPLWYWQQHGSDILQEPALRSLLAIHNDTIRQNQLSILEKISRFHWFNEEFFNASGFVWLEHEIMLIGSDNQPYPYDLPVTIICNAIESTTSFSHLTRWLSCLRDCLMRSPPSGYSQAGPRTGHARQIRRLLLERREQDLENTAEHSESSQYDFIRACSEPEWEEWRIFMEEMLIGLKEGYLTDNYPRFIADPGGICERS